VREGAFPPDEDEEGPTCRYSSNPDPTPLGNRLYRYHTIPDPERAIPAEYDLLPSLVPKNAFRSYLNNIPVPEYKDRESYRTLRGRPFRGKDDNQPEGNDWHPSHGDFPPWEPFVLPESEEDQSPESVPDLEAMIRELARNDAGQAVIEAITGNGTTEEVAQGVTEAAETAVKGKKKRVMEDDADAPKKKKKVGKKTVVTRSDKTL
jgi:hypothetical protein